MVADIAKLEAGTQGRGPARQIRLHQRRAKSWLAKMDGQRLDLLTPESVNAWRNRTSPKPAPIRSPASPPSGPPLLPPLHPVPVHPRCHSLLKVALPANPFAGVKLKDPGPQRYRSDVKPGMAPGLRRERTAARAAPALPRPGPVPVGRPAAQGGRFADLAAGRFRARASFKSAGRPILSPRPRRASGRLTSPAASSTCSAHSSPASELGIRPGRLGARNPAATYDIYRCDCTWRD